MAINRANNETGTPEDVRENTCPTAGQTGWDTTKIVKNNHPTVKPIALMAYLIKLITPVGGTVLDPFMGSGSTGCAAAQEGFDFIGIEMDENYVEVAKARIEYWRK